MNIYKKSWIVGMRTLHRKLLQICNRLPVVVEFFYWYDYISSYYCNATISIHASDGWTPSDSIPISGPTLGPTSFGGPQSNCRVLFGSVFDASSGQGGDNNGNDGNGGTIGSRTVQVQLQGVSTFNLGIKPKDPPVLHGRANEDVSTWVAKVLDFFYLTEAIPR